jgi:signal transduction histidine kinase
LEWAQLFVPLVYEEKVMNGLLVLGSRFSCNVYSSRDLEMFADIAGQAALIYANVCSVEALEQERERIARDLRDIGVALHDEPLQDLVFVREKLIEGQADARLLHFVNKAIGDLRQVIDTGCLPMPDQELPLALEALVEEMRGRRPETSVWWRDDTTRPVKLSDEQSEMLYYIAQEAINNALKHAQAKNITVTLAGSNGTLKLSVQDDGVGLPKPADVLQAGRSHGLRNMRERAAMIHARLSIASAPGEGTAVSVELGA